MTRAGGLLAYNTDAPSCSPSSWPHFHHDNANSGDYSRDAMSPGKPYDVSLSGNVITFKAPGNDLLCGRTGAYQIVQSDTPITPENFVTKEEILPIGLSPEAPGTTRTFTLPANLKRYVAIRSVDGQGNVGRPAIVTVDQLSVTKTDSPDPVSVGGRLTYTIDVTNHNASDANGVTVTDLLPKNVRLVSARSNSARCLERKPRTVTCNLAGIASGETATITIVVRPTRAGTIVNSATAAASSPVDLYPANNTATTTTEVTP